MSKFVKRVILPVGAALFLACLLRPLCMENGQCDYLKLWLFMGIPFGIQKMFIWLIPGNFDLGGSIGVVVFNMLIGGLIGGVVLAWRLLIAAIYLPVSLFQGIWNVARRKA